MKNVIVFGACSAIAQATERLWAKEGARLVLIDKDEQKLRIVADDLKTRGAASVHAIATNLNNLEQHFTICNQAFPQPTPGVGGGSEVVVLIAYGTLGDQRAGEKDFTTAHGELMTNFVSVASLLTEIVNRVLITDYPSTSSSGSRGRLPITLAIISSVAGDRGRQSNYIYGTAKGALTIFLQGLRNRLANTNIHVLTIKPGFVDTPMTTNFKKGLLWVKPEVVARGIVRAVDKKQDVVYLPWFWRYIMLIIRSIPERIFKKMKL